MLQLLFLIALIGFVCWLVETFIPMSDPWKTLFRVVAVVCIIFIVLQAVGVRLPSGVSLR